MVYKESYFLNLSFLGKDYFGVTKAKEGPTLVQRIEYYLGEDVLGDVWIWPGSRLDSAVSASDLWLEIVIKGSSSEHIQFDLLPRIVDRLKAISDPEIKIHRLCKNTDGCNLISALSEKTYRYFIYTNNDFSNFGSVPIATFDESIHLSDWQKWVSLFCGTHHFEAFCIRAKTSSNFTRTISHAAVFRLADTQNKSLNPDIELDSIKLNWLGLNKLDPQKIIVVEFSGSGFLRGQVRMMVGALIKLSKKEINIEGIDKALRGESKVKAGFKVPGHGLVLWQSTLKNPCLPIVLDLDYRQG